MTERSMKKLIVPLAAPLAVALLLSACGLDPPASKAATAPRACPTGSTVNVVGDSITVYTAAALSDHLMAAGYMPAINARSEREIREGLETIRGYVQLPGQRCWVIALGTNDVYRLDPSGWQDSVNALVALIPAADPHWWVSVAAPAAPQSDDDFNALVPYPMIRWLPIPEELKDEVHPNAAGVDLWVSDVMATLTSS